MSTRPDLKAAFSKRWARRRSKAAATAADYMRRIHRPGTPQDVSSGQAKNSRHRKVTANRWNQ
ncbi:MAG: hypothetical protein QOJ12_395 [Thermoleophilales bacterium]|nr:hypothetical protein [Thermoleophilales bacterium]